MSNNKNLLGQLAAARARAKSDAEIRTPKLATVAPPKRTQAPEPAESAAAAPRQAAARAKPKAKPATEAQAAPATKRQGTLERTTITLKALDRSVLGKAQAFFIERGIKAPTSSTLIRLALMNLADTLDAKPDRVQRIFERIRSEDGRRNTNTKT